MVKKFRELVLTQDTVFEEAIEVEESIRCEGGQFSLRVAGDIDAGNIVAGNIVAVNIDAGNIDAWNIDAWNIVAGDIDAWNIVAGNIDARNIVCESRKKKTKTAKTICCVFVVNRSKLERKEQMPEEANKK